MFKNTVLIILLFLALTGPGLAAAQDTPAESPQIVVEAAPAESENVQTVQNMMALVAYGLGLVLFAVLVIFVIGLLWKLFNWLDLKTGNVDKQLAPFGNTFMGKSLHQWLEQLKGQVDEVGDPLIQASLTFAPLRKAQQAGLITPEQYTQMVSGMVQRAIELTDGVPNVRFEMELPAAIEGVPQN